MFKPTIEDWRLEKNGVCINAVLTSTSLRIKYHKSDLNYKFVINNITYFGNSFEKRNIGDSICVVYLQDNPKVSRPFKNFKNQAEINCKCK